jgi:TonB family protein
VRSILPFLFLLPLAGAAQTADDVVQSFIGRPFILPHRGADKKIKLERSELSHLSGSCDIAVLVEAGDWNRGKVRLILQNIGSLLIYERRQSYCTFDRKEIPFELSGFAPDEPADRLLSTLHGVLQTPEEYLASKAIPFQYPPAPDDEDVIEHESTLVAPKPILRVECAYTAIARELRLTGSVRLSAIIGTDGRAHKARVLAGIGGGLDENALIALTLWRFEPAQKEGRPVATRANISMNFRIL